MTGLKRQVVLFGALVLMLGLLAAWQVNRAGAKRDSAMRAAGDLARCRMLAASIRAARDQPAVAVVSEMQMQELGEKIETACGVAGIEPQSLQGVIPGAARRLGDSPYQVKPTVLSFRGVMLGQVSEMLYHLTDGGGLRVRDLRIRAPHDGDSDQLWDAEITLTYLLYSPLPAS